MGKSMKSMKADCSHAGASVEENPAKRARSHDLGSLNSSTRSVQ